MKKVFFLLLFTLGLSAISYAQKHNTKCMRCKYSKYALSKKTKELLKGTAMDECGCVACAVKAKKEQVARQAEEKRRLEAIAAQNKAKKEAQEKAQEEIRIARENKKRRQLEEEARLKGEPAEGTQRLDPLRNRYLGNNKGSGLSGDDNTGFIAELAGFSDNNKKVYGIKLQDSIVFSAPFPEGVKTIYLGRLGKSNYFVLDCFYEGAKWDYHYFNNHSKLMNMYGQIVKIDGMDTFYSIRINEADKAIEMIHLKEAFTKSHSETLKYEWTKNHKTLVYNSVSDAVAVHQSLIEAADADYKAKYSASARSGEVTIGNASEYIYTANGVVLKTDLNLKVLNNQPGIVFTYNRN